MKRIVVVSLLYVGLAFAVRIENWGGFSATGIFFDFETELHNINGDTSLHYGLVIIGNPGPVITAQGWGQIGSLSIGAWGGGFLKQYRIGDIDHYLYHSLGYGIGNIEVGLAIEPWGFILIKPAIDLGGSLALIEQQINNGFVTDIYRATILQANAGAALTLQFDIPLREYRYMGIFVKGGYLVPVYPFFGSLETGIYGPYLTAGINLGLKQEYQKGPSQNWDE